jgi:hypothetical protein
LYVFYTHPSHLHIHQSSLWFLSQTCIMNMINIAMIFRAYFYPSYFAFTHRPEGNSHVLMELRVTHFKFLFHFWFFTQINKLSIIISCFFRIKNRIIIINRWLCIIICCQSKIYLNSRADQFLRPITFIGIFCIFIRFRLVWQVLI